MVACVGQQSVGGKRCFNGFKQRTLPHFRRGEVTPQSECSGGRVQEMGAFSLLVYHPAFALPVLVAVNMHLPPSWPHLLPRPGPKATQVLVSPYVSACFDGPHH
jgi:hypothetical protein